MGVMLVHRHSFLPAIRKLGNSGDPKAKANGVEKKTQSEVRSGLLLLTPWPGGAAAPFRPFILLPGIRSSLIQSERLGDIPEHP